MSMRIFTRTVLVLVVLYSALWYFRDRILVHVLNAAFHIASSQLVPQGIEIEAIQFEGARFLSLRSIEILGLNARIRSDGRLLEGRPVEFFARSDSLQLDFTRASTAQAVMRLVNAEGRFIGRQLPEQIPFDRVEGVIWDQTVPLSFSRPSLPVTALRQSLLEIIEDNCTRADLRLSATLVVGTNGETAYIPVQSVTEGDCTSLTIDPERIRGLLRSGDNDFTEEEIRVVAAHPLRAPVTIRLASLARRTASDLDTRIPNFPKDAYRHIYWSYLLTLRFGPEYAQAVTDAHESLEFNTREEAAMDVHNNEIGRLYALESLPEDQLLQRVLTDPKVIWSPSQLAP